MNVKDPAPKHAYIIERLKSEEESVILTRTTLTKDGWIISGKMSFPDRAEALAKIMRSHGFEREFPKNYGMSSVVEHWTAPDCERK